MNRPQPRTDPKPMQALSAAHVELSAAARQLEALLAPAPRVVRLPLEKES